MRIGLNEQLEINNISLYTLSRTSGIPYPTLHKIYSEKTSSIKFEILERICNTLDCTPNDILICEKDDE